LRESWPLVARRGPL